MHRVVFAPPEAFLPDGSIYLVDVMVLSGLASSKSEARRLIRQGAVTIWKLSGLAQR
jgi:tyrosyl-tRNA synthetase